MDEHNIENVPTEEEFGCTGVQIEGIRPGVAAKTIDDHGHSKTKDDPGEELCLRKPIIHSKADLTSLNDDQRSKQLTVDICSNAYRNMSAF